MEEGLFLATPASILLTSFIFAPSVGSTSPGPLQEKFGRGIDSGRMAMDRTPSIRNIQLKMKYFIDYCRHQQDARASLLSKSILWWAEEHARHATVLVCCQTFAETRQMGRDSVQRTARSTCSRPKSTTPWLCFSCKRCLSFVRRSCSFSGFLFLGAAQQLRTQLTADLSQPGWPRKVASVRMVEQRDKPTQRIHRVRSETKPTNQPDSS